MAVPSTGANNKRKLPSWVEAIRKPEKAVSLSNRARAFFAKCKAGDDDMLPPPKRSLACRTPSTHGESAGLDTTLIPPREEDNDECSSGEPMGAPVSLLEDSLPSSEVEGKRKTPHWLRSEDDAKPATKGQDRRKMPNWLGSEEAKPSVTAKALVKLDHRSTDPQPSSASTFEHSSREVGQNSSRMLPPSCKDSSKTKTPCWITVKPAQKGIEWISDLPSQTQEHLGVTYHTSALPMASPTSDDRPKRVLPSTLLPNSGTAIDYVEGHCRKFPSWHMLEVLDSKKFKEESCPREGLMTISLLKHQRVALAWMEQREKGTECSGGILADDQGLGKTVTTMALILKSKAPAQEGLGQITSRAASQHLHTGDNNPQSHDLESLASARKKRTMKDYTSAGTLIVCPTSVLRQWGQEFKEKLTEAAGLSVLLYHGSSRTKDPAELARHDVVLTTYSIVSLEVPRQATVMIDADEPLFGSERKKKRARSSRKKRTRTKLSTAVPVSDNGSGALAHVTWFRVVLDEAQTIKNPRAQIALACMGLRSERKWCLTGTPVQNTIDDVYSYFRFLKYDPLSDYKTFELEIKYPLAQNPAYGFRKLQHVLQNVMLRRTKTTCIDGKPIIQLPKKSVSLKHIEFNTAERAFYTELEVQFCKTFQKYAATGSVQKNFVNILSMLLRLRQACNHRLLVQGLPSRCSRESSKSRCNLSSDMKNSFLSVLEGNCHTCNICDDIPEDAVITMCRHVFCRQCISDRMGCDDFAICPNPDCTALLKPSEIFSKSMLKSSGGSDFSTTPSNLALKSITIELSSKIKAVIETLNALPRLKYSSHGDLDSKSAAEKPLDDCNLVPKDSFTEKAIVFSQWTSMLDLLEVALQREGFCYRRLDGSMSTQSRERALLDFKTLPQVSVMIMSLKAASLGLNLVVASHVLLLDVWWNPTVEEQAIDRAHRIGQTKNVHVSRFAVKNTIEDRILALQDRKRQMVASAFGEEGGAEQTMHLTETDMNYLFHV